ncbi:MAG TPA: bifunctional phosphoribosyl-AMP cyclohydrolase/phosphoribosyl-ATP diphosphatase HisIE [Bacteroidota bacterium]|nr:bifunctional phosphoribosyl-AMP cyclohydrolase/phosphoribosyl-ATP diphosphatase HisIE [Bacteroidota bacterium]
MQSTFNIDKINFSKLNGLVPAVIQDSADGSVLMLGFMNREALQKTLAEKQVVFWSRSKQRLWKKGETSGNFLDVQSIALDCDGDALLISAKPHGPTCHTGERSCFGSRPSPPAPLPTGERGDAIAELASVIHERKMTMPEDSYTAKLFRKGISRIAQKVGEEAVELAIAAQYPDKQRCIEESADLLYHLLVLLEEKGIGLSDVYTELNSRKK